ncbi:hypothetical protein XA68_14667 [Ophiocordyceps unilateralis]|uniref:Uncharacterized protein n=1 Tax=Ophiocordyceps unilateralis TaxID=268505 RepID=A0A2A9P908_OPHUN|nr:hypothetical protein XA68_14667 [Ophiocordyceps unilateralis]
MVFSPFQVNEAHASLPVSENPLSLSPPCQDQTSQWYSGPEGDKNKVTRKAAFGLGASASSAEALKDDRLEDDEPPGLIHVFLICTP